MAQALLLTLLLLSTVVLMGAGMAMIEAASEHRTIPTVVAALAMAIQWAGIFLKWLWLPEGIPQKGEEPRRRFSLHRALIIFLAASIHVGVFVGVREHLYLLIFDAGAEVERLREWQIGALRVLLDGLLAVPEGIFGSSWFFASRQCSGQGEEEERP